jgi:hypothetical protein
LLHAGYLAANSVKLPPSETVADAGAKMPLSMTPFMFIDLLRMHYDSGRISRRFHRGKQLAQR